MKAVIMAGGEGSRLRPLTCNRPKPMVPVVNAPILQHILNLLKAHGITDVVLTLQFMPTAIMNHFGDGSGLGMRMRYVVEDSPLGTAGSVRNAARLLDEPFLVLSGDALTDFDLTRLYEYHVSTGAKATLALTRVSNPVELGIVITNPDGSIRKFLEKPSWGEVFSDTVNTGIYVLDPSILQKVPEGRPFDFSKDLFPTLLASREPMFGLVLDGYWCDIGNLEQYVQAQIDAMDRKVNLAIPGSGTSQGVWVSGEAAISQGAVVIPPVVIGDGARIAPGAVVGPHTVVGRGSQVCAGASLRRAVLWDGVFVGEGCEVRGAVLCDRVQAKPNAKVFEMAVVGDDTRVEERSVVKPGVKIWPNKIVGKAATVHESMVWGNVAPISQVKSLGLAGLPNTDVTPEAVTRMCAALGGALGGKGTAVVAADSRTAAQMLRQAAACGFTSSGMDVIDLGLGMPPIIRFAVRLLGAQCGVAVKRGVSGDDSVVVEIYDSRGVNLPADMQRKVNHSLARGDFGRVPSESIGRVTFCPSVVSDYLGNMSEGLDADAIRTQALRLYAAVPAEAEDLVDMAGERFGFEINVTGGAGDVEALVGSDGASVGAVFGPTMESVSLVDETGRVIAGVALHALLLRALLETRPGSTVVVPANFPGYAEELARVLGGRVVRSKTSVPALMSKMLEHSEKSGSPQFRVWFDGLSCLLWLLEWRGHSGATFAELSGAAPGTIVAARTVHCPWEAKGRVMRTLVTTLPHDDEVPEGVRLRQERGWSLILPDEDEPAYHVYAEAASMEVASEIAESLARKVAELRDTGKE
ncbi:MAG: NTP transferase domain-containing protein [Firmicutes bacterium]|nr:NTP transferase domain-containing protein [Bacillota bacterium]